MRVLILDDENSKALKIKELLVSKCGLHDEEIDLVPSIVEAVGKMNKMIYDLLITDMCVPLVYGSALSEDGGLQLIQMINSDKRILAPRNIVVLTAFVELKEKYNTEVEKLSFDLIVFDDSSEEWKTKIVDKLLYLKRVESSPKEKRDYLYDVAILTAVKPEKNAVNKLSSNWKKISIEGDSTLYFETVWSLDGKDYRIVWSNLIQMGMVAATAISMKLVYNFVPRFLIMPGIAAGVKSEYEFGDIIIPKEVKDYCSGKYTTPLNDKEKEDAKKNPMKFFVPTSSSISTDEEVIDKTVEDFTEVIRQIYMKWPDYSKYKLPSIRNGNMVSGDSVIQNNAVIENLIKSHLRQADGLDMEAYGMYYAAKNAIQPKPIPICMKAISDFGDKSKSDEHQDFAAYMSANFMKYFILNVLMQ